MNVNTCALNHSRGVEELHVENVLEKVPDNSHTLTTLTNYLKAIKNAIYVHFNEGLHL